MPRFHPSSHLTSRSEQEFARLLCGLGDDWHVFPNVEFRNHDKTGHVREVGEIDVVAYHPSEGFVAIEVKAGSWKSVDGLWWHRWRGGQEWIRTNDDPFDQAQRGFFWLREALGKTVRRGPKPKVAWAVAFPDSDRETSLLPESVRRSVLDRTMARDPEGCLRAILRLEARIDHPVPRSREEEDAWFQVLRPPTEVLECAEAELDRGLFEAGKVSREIRVLARALRDQRRLRVQGPPGSGKTVLGLAWLRAQDDALRGYLCFNAPLASWVGQDPDAKSGSVEVRTFHDLGRALIEAAFPGTWPEHLADGFWQTDFLPAFERAVESLRSEGALDTFDGLVVDEAQDFPASWWPLIESILSPDGKLMVCLDPLQDLRGTWEGLPRSLDAVHPVHLDSVRRIPVVVQAWLGEALGEAWEAHPDLDPNGGLVEEHAWTTPEQQKVLVQEVLDSLTITEGIDPARILVVSLRARQHAAWGTGLRQGRWVQDRGFVPRRHVRMDTTLRSKGLEADVVVIPDLDRQASDYVTKLLPRLRVAASRTTSRLVVLARG